MTKRQFILALMENYALLKEDAEKVTELVFGEIRNQLLQGKEVRITGVGTFTFKYFKGGIVNNNLRGERHEVGPRVKLKFRPHPSIRRDLNNGLAKEITRAEKD